MSTDYDSVRITHATFLRLEACQREMARRAGIYVEGQERSVTKGSVVARAIRALEIELGIAATTEET